MADGPRMNDTAIETAFASPGTSRTAPIDCGIEELAVPSAYQHNAAMLAVFSKAFSLFELEIYSAT